MSFAIQFAATIILARYFLGPEEVGLFSIAFAAAAMLSVLQDFGLTRYISGEKELSSEQIATCFWVSVVFALTIGFAIGGIAWPAARFYEEERLFPLLLIIASSYLLVPFAIVPTALLHRKMDFASICTINVGAALANALVSILLAAAGWSAAALAWGAVAQQGARALISMWRGGWFLPWPPRMRAVGPILRFGSGSSVLAISGTIGTRTPELIIGRLIDFVAIGLYSRATGLAGQLRHLLTGAISGVFFPAFARIRDRGEDLAEPYMRVVAGYSAVTWPAMAFLAAASTPLVLMLFGPVWAGVAPLLIWISLSEIVFTAVPLHIEMPIILGRMRKLLKLNLLDTLVSIGLLFVAATWSLELAAASRLGYALIWFGIYAAFMRSLIGFSWREMLRLYGKSLAATAATVAPLLMLYFVRPPQEVGFLELSACALAGIGCWLAAIFLLRHPVRDELAAMLQTLRSSLPPPARAESR